MRLALALLFACGAREPGPVVDYGPPSAPVDPIACPAATLETFATRIGAPVSISTEQIVDAERVDKLPCQPAETNDQCIERARKRPLPLSYEIKSVTIRNEVSVVTYTYEIDGRVMIDNADGPREMVAKIKALEAKGHKIAMLNYSTAEDIGTRHAAITFRGIGGSQRRIGTIRIRAAEPSATMAEAHDAAARDLLDIRSMEVDKEGDLVIVVTCGNVRSPQ